MNNNTKIAKLKRKVCLAFPVENEPEVRIQKREEGESTEFNVSSNLLGCVIENNCWYRDEESAVNKTLSLSSKLIDDMYKMVYLKYKLDKKNKQKDKRESLCVDEKRRESVGRKKESLKNESIREEGNTQNNKRDSLQNRTQRIKKQTKQTIGQPTFSENKNVTKNNIVYSVAGAVENPGEFIETYCKGKTIPFPEYLLEKSNGVFLCRATFLNERFESRYAYDMETAKKDAANLIISFINYKINESNDIEYKRKLNQFLKDENALSFNKKCEEETKQTEQVHKNLITKPFEDLSVDVDHTEIQDIVDSFRSLHDDKNDFLDLEMLHRD